MLQAVQQPVISQSGTCTRTGCGQSVIGVVIPALGHQGVNAVLPNCEEDGNTGMGICTREGCGQTVNGTVIPALGHEGLTPAFAATCTMAGNSELSGLCTRAGCGMSIKGTIIPALGHLGLTPAFEATCTTEGNNYESGTCTRIGCGQIITGNVIFALGHVFNWEMPGIKNCKHNGCYINPIIEDTGPAGGEIFYIDEVSFNVPSYTEGTGATEYLNYEGYTAYYLEAAPSNMATTLLWASSSVLIPGLSQNSSDETDWVIGRGRINTAIIVAHGINYSPRYIIPAAGECKALNTGGKTDWFLPSKNELNEIYKRRVDLNIPWSGAFWSSSQCNTNSAWYQSFSYGYQYNSNKDETNATVRAIRAF